MFRRLGRGVVAHPWLVILGWIVAAVAVITLAPNLTDVTNSNQTSFLPDSTESSKATALATRAFPNSEGATSIVILQRRDGRPLADADVKAIQDLSQGLGAARIANLQAAAFSPRSVSPNKQVALVQLQFVGQPQDQAVLDAVGAVRGHLAGAVRSTDLQYGVTGDAALTVDNIDAFEDAERISGQVTIGLIIVLMLVIFRSPIAALLPILTIGLVFTATGSVVGLIAKLFGFEVGLELGALMIVVLFGIGTDYILFLLFRVRERLRAGDDVKTAVVTAVERVGEAIASAALAVIAAFCALLLASLGFLRTLGPGLAIAVGLMLLAALTLVPAVVTVLGTKVFWLSKSWRTQPRGTTFARLGRLVAHRPQWVAAGSLVLLVAVGLGAFSFKANYDQISQLPEGTESTRAYQDLQKGFPPGALNPVQLYLTSPSRLDQAAVTGYVDRVSRAEGVQAALDVQTSADGRTAAIPLLLREAPFTNKALDQVGGPIRETAHAAAPPGTTAFVGGPTSAFADIRTATNRDLAVIFPVAGVLFLLILALLLRSLVAPFYVVVSVVLGFAATLGASVLVFQGLLDHAGLIFIVPVVLYLFVTAIGTDYNILMTARLREQAREGNGPREAVALAIEHSGPSVAAAAVILAGTFASFMLAGVSFFYEIGFSVTIGILIVAFLVSLLLVPSVTALVGHAAWWPGHADRPQAPPPPPPIAGEEEELTPVG